MKIVVCGYTIKVGKDVEEIPFDETKFRLEQNLLSYCHEQQEAKQTKLRNEMLEQAIIDFWESLEQRKK